MLLLKILQVLYLIFNIADKILGWSHKSSKDIKEAVKEKHNEKIKNISNGDLADDNTSRLKLL